MVEPGLYKGISVGACARRPFVVVVGVGPGEAAPEEVADGVRKFAFCSGTLDVVRLLFLEPAGGEGLSESVLRPAWNLRNAASAAASLALGPDIPLPPGAPFSDVFAPSFASGGVLFGTVMTCLTGVGAGGAGPGAAEPDAGLVWNDVASRSIVPGETRPGALLVSVGSSCGRWPRSFSAGGAPHGCQVPPALKPWNCLGGWCH